MEFAQSEVISSLCCVGNLYCMVYPLTPILHSHFFMSWIIACIKNPLYIAEEDMNM